MNVYSNNKLQGLPSLSDRERERESEISRKINGANRAHNNPHKRNKNARSLNRNRPSDPPPSPSSYSVLHIVGDLIGLLDHLGIDRVFLVGHDWGAIIAWYFCLLRPDRIKALVNLSVPFMRRHPAVNFVEGFRAFFGDDFYICRFQQAGEVEQDLGSVDPATMMKKLFNLFSDPKPPCIPKEVGFRGFKSSDTLPSWLSEDDITYFATKFSKTGFTGGLNYYRALDLIWELTAAWSGAQVKVPVKFIMGELDLTYHFPGVKEYIHNGGFNEDVPNLQQVVVMEGVAHFINQERPEEISTHIYDFIKNF